jgi:GNAT superfamily N-acetyltransferase
MAAELRNSVAGYMVYKLYEDEKQIRLINFAVAPAYRRHYVGSQMVNKLKEKLLSSRRTCIIVEIRETNLAALLFFRQNGFKFFASFENCYEDCPEEKMYIMVFGNTEGAIIVPDICRQQNKENIEELGFEPTKWNPEDLKEEDRWGLW